MDGRDRAAELGGDLAQAVAMLDVRDHGQAGRWNEEDLTPDLHEAIRVPPQTWRGVWNDEPEDAEVVNRLDANRGCGRRSDDDFWPVEKVENWGQVPPCSTYSTRRPTARCVSSGSSQTG